MVTQIHLLVSHKSHKWIGFVLGTVYKFSYLITYRPSALKAVPVVGALGASLDIGE